MPKITRKLLLISLFIVSIFIPIAFTNAVSVSNDPINAVVQITCVNDQYTVVKGSGVIVSPDGKIITNAHVVASDPYKLWGCFGGIITKENSYKPDTFFNIKFFYSNTTNDLSFGKIDGSYDGASLYLTKSDILNLYPYLKLNFNSSIGQEINAVGYPGIAGGNLNITKGSITSKPMVGDYNYLLSDVSVSYGNSGGAVVNKNGELLGLATSVNSSDLAKVTYVLDVNSLNIEKSWIEKVINVNNFTSGAEIEAKNFINELLAINQFSINGAQKSCVDLAVGSQGAYSQNGKCYCNNPKYYYNEDNKMCFLIKIIPDNIIQKQTTPAKKIDTQLTKKLLGRILLQVESRGEAWYLNPKDSKRYYMANGDEAYNIMRNLGIGITNKDLNKIKANKALAKKYSGKIFLQVEANGEAYYVNFDGNLYYLKNGAEAYNVMRNLGLGISNKDLDKIPTTS